VGQLEGLANGVDRRDLLSLAAHRRVAAPTIERIPERYRVAELFIR
jgi:hypothetical protein